MKYSNLQVDCEEVIFEESIPMVINKIVTEPQDFFDNDFDEGVEEIHRYFMDAFKQGEEFSVSHENDYHKVRLPGFLESIEQYVVPRECQENSDIIHLASFVMGKIASNHPFGEGNKRTAFATGCVMIILFQFRRGVEEPLYPVLGETMLEILEDVSMGSEGFAEIESHLGAGREELSNLIEKAKE